MYLHSSHDLYVTKKKVQMENNLLIESRSFLSFVAGCKNFPNLHNSLTLFILSNLTSLKTLAL